MTARLTGAIAPKAKKAAPKAKDAVVDGKDAAAPVHLPDGVFDVKREDGDAPVSELKAADLHPIALDKAQEKSGGAQAWKEPFPATGVVVVRFRGSQNIGGRAFADAGEVKVIPAELAHSISLNIEEAPTDDA